MTDRPRLARLIAPTAGSFVLHAALLVATTAVVWRVVERAEPERARPVTISMRDPAAARGDEESVAPPAPQPPPPSAGSAADRRVAELLDSPPAKPELTSGAAPPAESAALAERALRALSAASEPAAAALSAADDIRPLLPAGGVKFAGLGTSNARSVVYVVDGSGPMVTSLPAVLGEVARSVSKLDESQRFAVVVFRRPPPPRPGRDPAEPPRGVETFTPVPVRATADAKRRLAAWLREVRPTGESNPLSGLRVAIEMGPDAVFLLSRGIERSGGGVWDAGLERTMEELDSLNPMIGSPAGVRARRVCIKTVQFLDEDPTGIMQAIGELHGGGPGSVGAGAAGGDLGYRVVHTGEELGPP